MKVKETVHIIELNDAEVQVICRLIDLFRSNKEVCENNLDLVCDTNNILLALSNHSVIAQKSAQTWLIDEYKKEVDRILGDNDNE